MRFFREHNASAVRVGIFMTSCRASPWVIFGEMGTGAMFADWVLFFAEVCVVAEFLVLVALCYRDLNEV